MATIRCGCALVFLFASVAIGLSAQTGPRRVTVATSKGDTIEGTLKSISEAAVIVEIAGSAISIPMSDVTYVSFTGKLGAGGSGPAPPMSPIERAFASLKKLRSVVEIGVLRDQYSAELVNALPVVREFTKTGNDEWLDVKLAMESAIGEFQRPLSSVSAWSEASEAMTRAAAWSDHAASLADDPAERTHRESSASTPISIGSTAKGRLGIGDQLLPRSLDRNFAEGFSDIYMLQITVPTEVSVAMNSVPCMAHITITDADDKKIEGDGLGLKQVASIRRRLPAGPYRIWASAEAGRVCRYELAVTAK